MKTIVSLIFISVFLFSCNNPNSLRVKRFTNEKGELNILTYKTKNGDTLLERKQQYYWTNGQIKDEIDFNDGLKNGWDCHYDSLGLIKNKFYFKRGVRDSVGYYYNALGKVSAETYYLNGVEVFVIGRFSDSILPYYQVLRKDGFVQYMVGFDSVGKKVYENGFIFDDSLIFENGLNPDSLKVNTNIEAKIFTTKVPGYSRIIRMDYFGDDHKKINIDNQIIDSGFYSYIKFTPNKVGKATLVLLGELRDEKNNLVKRDTIGVKIKIK